MLYHDRRRRHQKSSRRFGPVASGRAFHSDLAVSAAALFRFISLTCAPFVERLGLNGRRPLALVSDRAPKGLRRGWLPPSRPERLAT